MEKRKNKIPKKALAFASALILVLSLFSTIAFAQAPYYDFDYSVTTSNSGYTNSFIYFCDVNTSDVIFILNQVYDLYDNYAPVTDINIILTENYYNYFYVNDSIGDILQHKFDCYSYLMKNSVSGNFRDGSSFYPNVNISEFISNFSNDFLYQHIPFTELEIYNSILAAQSYQFDFWQNQINRLKNEKSVAFDNGFAEGQEAGLQTGYNNGYNDGLDVGYNEGYANGNTIGRAEGYNQGLSEGEHLGYDSGFQVGKNEGYNSGLTVGYTNAINDYDYFTRGIFTVFSAPFEFVRQLTFFDVFGVAIFPIFAIIILVLLAFLIFKFVKGGLF